MLSLLVLLIGLFSVPVSAAEPPVYLASFGPDGTATANFEGVNSVATDQQTGAVYVLDSVAGVLYKFDAEGQPVDFSGSASYIEGNKITGLSPFTGRGQSKVAVDSSSHVVYVTEMNSIRALSESGEAAEFTSGPGAGTSEIPGFGSLYGVAVDLNGAIYATDFANGTVAIFASTGASITSFGTTGPETIAVAPDGVLYITHFPLARNFTPSEFPATSSTTYSVGAPLNSTSGEISVGLAVHPSTADVYVVETNFATSWITQYDSAGAVLHSFGNPGEAGELANAADGIAVAAEKIYVGNTNTSAFASKVQIFGPKVFPPLPPTIGSSSATNVTADSARLRAQINPNTVDTTYYFEYGLSDCSATPDPCSVLSVGNPDIGAGHDGVWVFRQLTGLQAETTYHFRVVATNSLGTTEGPDRTFTTQASRLGFELSDSRAWEMVSPPDKHGGKLIGTSAGLIQAAADGEGLAYLSIASIESGPEGNRATEPSTVLGRRDAAGWRSKDISPPNSRVIPLGIGQQSEYQLFNPNLTRAMVEPRDGSSLSPQASERTPYLSEGFEPPAYLPLVTGKEGFANVPPGTGFGGDEKNSFGSVRLIGATPDLSHIALRSEVPLVEGAPKTLPSLYVWMAGELRPLSVLPAAEGGEIVEGHLIGSGPGTLQHAISDDGSRVFWGLGNYGTSGGLTALYMRDTVASNTVRLDVIQPGASGSGGALPTFQGASADGTAIFFTDSQQLTDDASPSGRDLYRCEITLEAPSLGCSSLIDLSAPAEGSGESADVQRLVSGMSKDGSHVYFVARGVLDAAPNPAGANPVSGEPNLYLWKQGEGLRFIATLSDGDENDWGGAVGVTYNLSAASSPSGRYLSFMSERSLTGYDNHDAVSGELDQEVFRYDAVANRLDCVSCNPFGASPRGQISEPNESPWVDPQSQWAGQWVAAILPEATVNEVAGLSLYRPRSVLDNGRVFFNAADALVPADSNGQWDVYQYEPTGLGSCSPASGGAAVARSGDGCVGLISSGTGAEEAAFLDASGSGDDVFIATPARLSVLDEDTVHDVYDARVNGVPATLPRTTECLGEACQAAPQAPNDPTPASAVFAGAGNFHSARCPKGKRQIKRSGRTRCVAKKHSKHKRRAHKAGKNRRAGR